MKQRNDVFCITITLKNEQYHAYRNGNDKRV